MDTRVGTSGFQYKMWRGNFYSHGCKESQMLSEYGAQLPTVEINATFYRMPRRNVVEAWAARVPDGFRFTLKASRRITHQKRLKDAAEPLGYLLQNAQALGDRLGPILFQLPPSMRKDLPRLSDFLSLVPGDCLAAFEFRHPSWFEADVFARLREHNAALCIADVDEAAAGVPFEATADWGYLRLRKSEYALQELQSLAARMGEQGWSQAFAYFKHEELGAQLATGFQQLFDPPGRPT